MSSSDDGYLSDGGDAAAAQKRRPKTRDPSSRKPEPKRALSAQAFPDLMKSKHGIMLVPFGKHCGRPHSKRVACSKVAPNTTRAWASHGKTCRALKGSSSASAAVLRVAITSGGETHRKLLCDTYVSAYSIYKHKLPFTQGPRNKEVNVTPSPPFPFR